MPANLKETLKTTELVKRIEKSVLRAITSHTLRNLIKKYEESVVYAVLVNQTAALDSARGKNGEE